jgi:DNA-binding CsgD family transcriptional regulator/tetratricopeptide (TPR) repeat protein
VIADVAAAGDANPPSGGVGSASLLDRVAALADLDAALERVRSGRGEVVVVSGEAGIGKTTLVRRFLDGLPSDVVAFTGACDDLVTPRPLGPFHDIARRAGGDLGRLIRAGADPERIHDALLDLQARLPPPLVLVLEDVHWADQATLDAVTFLGRRLPQRPLLLVLTVRDVEVGPAHALTRVLASLPARHVTTRPLGPLTRSAVRQLAVGHAVDADELFELTGGNPFYVVEVLSTPGAELPATVGFAVTARLGQLPGSTRALLDGLALVPSGVDVRIVEVLEPDWRRIVTPAEAAGLVELRGARLGFRHELARLAVARQVAPIAARGWHARILDALRADEADPALLVHHAEGAGDDDAVARHAPSAAEAAHRVEAHREAVAHYERALAREDRLPPDEVGVLWLGLAQARMAAERSEAQALEAARRAVDLARKTGDPSALGHALAVMSRIASWAGDNRLAGDLADEALAVLQPLGDRAECGRAMVAAAYVALARWDAEAASSWAQQAADLAAQVGDPRTVAMARAYQGVVDIILRGDERQLEEGVSAAFELGDRRAALEGLMTAGTALVFRRDHRRALSYLSRALDVAATYEYTGWSVYLQTLRAHVLFDGGEWPAAERDLDAAFAVMDTRGWARAAGLIVRGRLAARRGVASAEADLREAWALASSAAVLQLCVPAAAGIAERAWLQGELDRPPPELLEVLAMPGATRWPAVAGELGVWLQRAGGEVGDLPAMTRPHRLVVQGRFAEAAAAWQELGCVYEAAEAAVLDDDPASVGRGLAVLDGLGAVPLARRARGRLRQMGLRVPRGPQPETRAHPAGLTRRQAEVLELLATGATNAEIADRLVLSIRTVDHHVAAILERLGVSSRHEAVRRAVELSG